MKQVTLNGRSILLVEVPEGAYNFVHAGKRNILFYDTEERPALRINTPPGNWQLLFADPLNPTEEEAAGVIPKIEGREKLKPYPDYEYNLSTCWTALESWHSFVNSHGFEIGKTVALIKK